MNMSKSRDIQAKMPSPKVIYASNESKSVLARNLEECRDNDKNRKACFYRLNAFWLVTVKVLNSYFNLTFHCTDHRALCKVFLHERVYTENRMLQTRYYSPVPVQQKLLPAVNSLLLSTSAAERSVPATVWCR